LQQKRRVYSEDSSRDISNIEDVENLDMYISPAQQIREMHKNYPDRVVPFAGEKDREKVIECVKKYFRAEEEPLKDKEFEFDDDFEVILDKDGENYFYAFFAI